MARIKYSGLIDNIRGSIGGTTFQANQYGFTVRRKPNMTDPNKNRQERQRPFVANATRAWRGLSSSQREAWDTFASTNPQAIKNDPSIFMSGYAVFTRLNVYRQMMGFVLYEDAPDPDVATASVEDIEILANPTTPIFRVTWSTTGTPMEFFTMVNVSSAIQAGVSKIGNRLRFIDSTNLNNPSLDAPDEYISVFGFIPTAGIRLGIQFVFMQIDNGWVERSAREIVTVQSI